MKSFLLIAFLMGLNGLFGQKSSTQNQPSIHALSFTSIDGESILLEKFKGKYILLVNVASECGFTPQYKDLQALHNQYGDKMVIIGFPCNQFGGQEPGKKEEIKGFCEKNFGVTFLLSEKIDVKGASQHPVYSWLTDKSKNGKSNSTVKWNFQKYLVDPEGKLIDYYYSVTKPDSPKILRHLQH